VQFTKLKAELFHHLKNSQTNILFNFHIVFKYKEDIKLNVSEGGASSSPVIKEVEEEEPQQVERPHLPARLEPPTAPPGLRSS